MKCRIQHVSMAIYLLLCAGLIVPIAHAQALEGDWVGGSNLFQNPAFVHVRFVPAPSGTGGVANVQAWKVSNRPLSAVAMDGSRIRFEFPSDAGVPYVAEGELQGGLIQGSMSRGT